MSGRKRPTAGSGLSRRSFVKSVAIASAAAAGGGYFINPANAAAPANDYNFDGCTHNMQGIFLNKANVTINDGAGQSLGLVINNKANASFPDGRLRFQGIEALTVGGRTYYYNWGVGGADGQSGHVWIADMSARPTVDSNARGGSGGLFNGRTAPDIFLGNGTRKSYLISPQPIPNDMYYIGPSDGLRHSYSNYGTPASPYSSGHTNLSWSWINKTGGGIVRCMMKTGETFYPADVSTININSTDANGTVNGSVKAMYGSIWNGAQRIFGWTVHSHHYGAQYVEHITCSNC
jgi:hypothetical protein